MNGEILVAREKDAFSLILTERGFSVINLPLVKTEPVDDLSELENHLENLDRFDGIFITSARAAEIFLAKAENKSFVGKFYVLGKRSRNLLEAAGYKLSSSDAAKTAAQLLDAIPKAELENKKFLFLGGNRSLRVVPDALKDVAEVTEVIVYRTVAVEQNENELVEIKEKFACGEIIAVCFFSPSGAKEFVKNFENFSQVETKIAAIGETTARFVEANNFRVDFVAEKPTAKNFAEDLIEYLRNKH